jgi:hypothetical protein
VTRTRPLPSPSAHRVVMASLALVVIAAGIVVLATSPTEDVAARTAPSTGGPSTTEPVPYGDLMLAAEISRAHEGAERSQADRVRRFLEGAAAAEAARAAAEQAAAAAAVEARAAMGGGWAALRRCESGGDYGAVSANGTYRGAYQFSRSTWNAVASRSHPHLVGVDPAAAAPGDQDAMALSLYRSSGSNPWPHCGRHL